MAGRGGTRSALKPPAAKLNDLSAKEWTQLSKSVLTSRDVSSVREEHHKIHGATFPVALAGRAIRMYTKAGDLVMDPFLGVADTLVAARGLGRGGVGFEIYDNFCSISRRLCAGVLGDGEQTIVNADCRLLEKHVKANSVQLTFTSPPYANFIQQSRRDRATTHKKSKIVLENNSAVKQYGNDPADFGNLKYDDFLADVSSLMESIYSVTRTGGYNVWVVKDHRMAKDGIPYVPVHSDIMDAGRRAGFTPHDLIVWDQNDQRSLVLLGYPTVFYVNVNHTYLVVMRKK